MIEKDIQKAIDNYREGRTANFSNKQFIQWLEFQQSSIKQKNQHIDHILADEQKWNDEIAGIKKQLDLAVKAFQDILECGGYGSTGEDAADMRRIADWAIAEIGGKA